MTGTVDPVYSKFLGTWILDPRTCDYQQGSPPIAGRYIITMRGDEILFRIEWVDEGGQSHAAEFSGPPSGEPVPFDGGDLADSLVIDAKSPRELTSRAFWRGKERMLAQRQLDDSGRAMRVTQLVRFSDGSSAYNIAVYVAQMQN